MEKPPSSTVHVPESLRTIKEVNVVEVVTRFGLINVKFVEYDKNTPIEPFDLVIAMFSVNQRSSYRALSSYVKDIFLKYKKTPVIVYGNKRDFIYRNISERSIILHKRFEKKYNVSTMYKTISVKESRYTDCYVRFTEEYLIAPSKIQTWWRTVVCPKARHQKKYVKVVDSINGNPGIKGFMYQYLKDAEELGGVVE